MSKQETVGQSGDHNEVPENVQLVSEGPQKVRRKPHSRRRKTADEIAIELAKSAKVDDNMVVVSPTQLCDEEGYVSLQYGNGRICAVRIKYHIEFLSSAIMLACNLTRILGIKHVFVEPIYFERETPTIICGVADQCPRFEVSDYGSDGESELHIDYLMLVDDSHEAKLFSEYLRRLQQSTRKAS